MKKCYIVLIYVLCDNVRDPTLSLTVKDSLFVAQVKRKYI